MSLQSRLAPYVLCGCGLLLGHACARVLLVALPGLVHTCLPYLPVCTQVSVMMEAMPSEQRGAGAVEDCQQVSPESKQHAWETTSCLNAPPHSHRIEQRRSIKLLAAQIGVGLRGEAGFGPWCGCLTPVLTRMDAI